MTPNACATDSNKIHNLTCHSLKNINKNCACESRVRAPPTSPLSLTIGCSHSHASLLRSYSIYNNSMRLSHWLNAVLLISPLNLATKCIRKNLPASRAHSHRAQLASLSAPRARDLIVALRAPIFLDLALRARSWALRIHLSLFLII